MKLVIEINQNKEPTKNDIMVFNEVLGMWEYKSQDEYLIGVKNEILARKEEIEDLNSQIIEIKKDISVLAKLLKEGM